eukprot:scaffold322211_cov30-Tisochrysis_lutea.AAC.1
MAGQCGSASSVRTSHSIDRAGASSVAAIGCRCWKRSATTQLSSSLQPSDGSRESASSTFAPSGSIRCRRIDWPPPGDAERSSPGKQTATLSADIPPRAQYPIPVDVRIDVIVIELIGVQENRASAVSLRLVELVPLCQHRADLGGDLMARLGFGDHGHL